MRKYLPAAHAVQELRDEVVLYEPAAHVVHAIEEAAAATLEYEPAGQAVQADVNGLGA